MSNFKITYEANDELLKQAIEIDKHVFNKAEVGNIDMCKKWLEANKDIYTFLLDGDVLVGYINFIRLTDECFEKFYKGQTKDYKLSLSDILPFTKGENRCLFMSIAIRKDYRDGEAIIELRKGFDTKLKNFEKQGIHIKDVVIDCVSVDGIKYSIDKLNANYVKKSKSEGKLYYSNNIFENRTMPKISFELLNRKNLKEIAQIQYQLFKDYWCGYADFLLEIENRQKNKLPVTYLIKHKGKSVGIIGLYELEEYKDVVWLNWYGVLPEYRNHGIGTHAFFKIVELARNYGKKEFRLVTYRVWNNKAQKIYRKTTQIAEEYKNKNDWQYGINVGKAMIYSLSLVDKKISKWKNKFINLNDDIRLHNESLRKLKEDKIIDF